jgi:ferredoxin
VTFVLQNGERKQVVGKEGQNLLDVAIANDVPSAYASWLGREAGRCER